MNRLINIILLMCVAYLAFDAGKRSRKPQPVAWRGSSKRVISTEKLPTIPARPAHDIAAHYVYNEVRDFYAKKGIVNE